MHCLYVVTSTPFFDVLLDVDDQDQSKFAIKITPPLFRSPFTDDLDKAFCLGKYQEEVRLKSGGNFDVNEAYNSYKNCLVSSLKGNLSCISFK